MNADERKKNAVFHALDGIFFFAGLTLFNRGQVVPALITDLKDSELLLGLVTLVFWLGHLIPQTIAAKKLEGLAYKKHAVLICGIFQRFGWALFLVSLFIAWQPAFTLTMFFAGLTINRLATGVIGPLWSDWYAKTSPQGSWASVLGMRRAVSGTVGIALGLFIRWVMGSFPSPDRYRILLSLSMGFFVISYLALLQVQEERQEGLPNNHDRSWGEYFRDLGRILLTPGHFRRLMAGCVAISLPMSIMVTFLTKYGLTYPGVSDGVTGTWTAVFQGTLAAGSVAGGLLSDRLNAVAPFRVAPGLFIGATVVTLFAPHPALVSVAWGLLGLALGIRLTGFLPALMHFAEPNRIPSYIAAGITVLGVPRAVIPLLSGYLVDKEVLSFPALFGLSGLLCLLGWFVLFGVQPPETPGYAAQQEQTG